MKDIYRQIAVVILIIAGLNCGLFGLFGFDLISAVVGKILGRLVFIGVGVTAGYMCYLFYLNKVKKLTT